MTREIKFRAWDKAKAIMRRVDAIEYGDAHTNNLEGFWSQLKRSINGTYHFVSPKHLQTYVNEFAYRYNRRKAATPIFLSLVEKVALPL